MDNELLVFVASVFCLLVGGYILRTARYLVFFYYFCYMLSFLPLLGVLFGEKAEFWTSSAFSFESDSVQVYALSLMWLFSSAGIFLGMLLLGRRRQSRLNAPAPGKRGLMDIQVSARSPVSVFVFLAIAVTVLLRFMVGEQFEAMFPGMDLLICSFIMFGWAAVLSTDPKQRRFTTITVLTLGYTYAQLTTGDRNFFVLVIGLLLLWMVGSQVSLRLLAKIGFAGLGIVISGAVISMVRMDVEVTGDELLLFLKFNSWNAVMLPVFAIIDAQWGQGAPLLGKTYLDLLLSSPPSPFFSLLGIEKPIVIDNPAAWFTVAGHGGMHSSGVALRNFGLMGVFIQEFLCTIGLIATENMMDRRKSFLRVFLFLTVASSIMHSIWYGMIYLVNSMVLYLILAALVIMTRWGGAQARPREEQAATNKSPAA